jgi:hypothetical protein
MSALGNFNRGFNRGNRFALPLPSSSVSSIGRRKTKRRRTAKKVPAIRSVKKTGGKRKTKRRVTKRKSKR